MVERNSIHDKEQSSEELLGVKVYFKDGLVSGLESEDGKRTSVNYLKKNNGQVKYRSGTPVVDEVVFPDGSKLKRDPKTGDHLNAEGKTLYASPVVHRPSMGDNQAFIHYRDPLGNPHTVYASRGDVDGPSLPIDRGLLVRLWEKNLPAIDMDHNGEVTLAELAKAVENHSFMGMDAVFVATLKKRFDLISQYAGGFSITGKDIAKIDRAFESFRPGYIGRPWGKSQDLDKILNSWVCFQNKAKFVTNELYLHGPAKSIRPEYVLQGDSGNCYWQSSLMTIAKASPKLIESMIRPGPDGTWKVLFPQKSWCREVITVKPLTESEQLLYSGAAGGGLWSGILEKAAGHYRVKHAKEEIKRPRSEEETVQDYLDGGVQTAMLNLLTDKYCAGKSPQASSLEELHQVLSQSLEKPIAMGAGVKKTKIKGLFGNHNYAVLGYDCESRMVTLYDPNHFVEPKKKMGQEKDAVRDGIFTMSLKEFQATCDEFNYIDKSLDENPWEKPYLMKRDLFDDSSIVKVSGQIAMVNQDEAIELCKKMGGHLPTAREFAERMNPEGILETEFVDKELGGKAPDGYYKVECENQGIKDVFYFNNSKSRKLSGDVAKLSFWTASKVLGNNNYGHVFYGWLGGGRQSKEDHHGSYKHAVLIIGPEESHDSH